jgi:polysaccharide pyruvyl transferase WcaK-like protein
MTVLNVLVTGYYYKKNLGDELFLEIAQKIFSKNTQLSIQYINTETIKANNILELCKWMDCLVLFGGEVINDYFMDKLISVREYGNVYLQKYIPIYGISVSCNADYQSIFSKVDVFDYIIFRNKKDYEYFSPRFQPSQCLYLPDIVFLKKRIQPINFWKKPERKMVGFFLSKTAISGLDKDMRESYYKYIIGIINYWTYKNRSVTLFSMCCSENVNEDDRIINRDIYERLTGKENEFVFLSKDNSEILPNMHQLEFAICWRFHAHVFCMSYGVPFLSISQTPKVINILSDNNILDLNYSDKNINQGINYLLDNKKRLREKLATIYEANFKKVVEYKSIYRYINTKKTNSPFYITNSHIEYILSNVTQLYNNKHIKGDHEFNASLLLYLLLGYAKSPYHWGLQQKLMSGATVETLILDLHWLVTEEIKAGGLCFYNKAIEYLNLGSIIYNHQTERCLNIYHFDQNDMKGVHRSGWQYVIEAIDKHFGTFDPRAVVCDLYLDRTFHWNYEQNYKLGIIPYTKFWIGFIHHTCNTDYSTYNIITMFKKPHFIASLKTCRGLVVLSNYLRSQIIPILDSLGYEIPVEVLYHPTETINERNLFTMTKFIQNKQRKIVQVGAWMRDIIAIYKLNLGNNLLGLEKCALKGPNMDSYYDNKKNSEQISRDNMVRGKIELLSQVRIINQLENFEYDILLSQNIVFIKLIDSSAVNTLIESMIRNTPILINPIEAVVEYLGKHYPLYYNSIEEAGIKANNMDLIKKAYNYLNSMDKSKLKIETFINGLRKTKLIQSIIAQ